MPTKNISFSVITEYLCDGYEEYFDAITSDNLKIYKDQIYSKVIEDEQFTMFKYLIKRIPLTDNELIDKLINKYKGGSCDKEFFDLINENFPNIYKRIIDIEFYYKHLRIKKLSWLKQLIKEREKNRIINHEVDYHKLDKYYGNNINSFNDINVLYWLISNDMIKLDEKIVEKIIKDYLTCKYVNLEDYQRISSRLNFNQDKLKKFLEKKTTSYNHNNGWFILDKLLQFNKEDMIYYLFSITEPKYFIWESKVDDIIALVIATGNHKLFKFIFKKIFMLKYVYYTYNMERRLNSLIDNEKNDDNRLIIYDLIKLGIEPPKGTKYYDLFKTIKIY